MLADKNSSGEAAQTTNTSVDNQDTKKKDLVTANDNHDKSLSPNAQVTQEPLQTTTLDGNRNNNTSTPELAATTNEAAKASTTPLLDPSSDPAATYANKHTAGDTPKSSTTTDPTSNPDSNSTNQTNPHTANSVTKQATNAVSTDDTPKTSTTMVEQTNPPKADNDNTKQDTSQSTETAKTDPQTRKDKQGNALPTDEPTTSQIPDSDANKQANTVSNDGSPKTPTTLVDQTNPPKADNVDTKQAISQSTEAANTDRQTSKDKQGNALPTDEPSTSQIPDSDANKQAKAVSTDGSPKTPTTMVDQTDHPKADNVDTKQATSQSTKTANTDPQTSKDNQGNALPTDEPTTSQIPDSNAHKQANAVSTDDSPKASTTMVDQTNPPKADNDNTNQATNQGTKTPTTDPQNSNDNQGNVLPKDEPTSQIPDSDASKPIKAVSTTDSPKSPTTMVLDSRKDSKLVDQSSPTVDSDTKKATDQSTETASTDPQTDMKKSSIDITPEADNKEQLANLIKQEIDIVKKICPKLGKHGNIIMEEAEKISNRHTKLEKETHGIKELKALKKAITKLKLQIPSRYMTYDETEKQRKQQLSIENSDNISDMLQKNMPRLHDKTFHESSVCNDIHLRFNELKLESKLCLLCFTVFPENATISRRSMIYWWIGEGLISREDNIEEYANEIFKELMDKGFIEPESKRSRSYVTNCKMKASVRAALVMIADEMKFFDFDEYGNPKDAGKFDEIESPEDMITIYPLGEPREFFIFYDDKNKEMIKQEIEITDSYQFAALPKGNEQPVDRNGVMIDQKKKFYYYERRKPRTKSYKVCLMGSGLSKGIPWENLHMLFNVKDVILDFKPEWFLRMKNVNILFLGKWQSSSTHHIEVEEDEFLNSFDYMNNVRFFSLQGVSRITKLPESISKLKSLLILDLRGCHNLEEIPETIGLLKSLTHLDMSECYLLRKIPKELSLLESLQVLKGFVVVETPEKGMCTLQDLKKLENLRKLSMYTHMKNFPQETHLESLQKLETLRKLTILWGGHDQSKPETYKTIIEDAANDKKRNLASKVKRYFPKKTRVQGIIRRMNAFNNSTLGMRLEKLDLKCFPYTETPYWLTADNLQGLKKLYIRGGHFSDLGQYQETFECDDSLPKDTWRVETLRLKYLDKLNMEWRELQNLFPKLKYLEKVKCPRLTLFPCNEKGVWMKKGSSTT